jgi:ubiquinone/menaquinone biosynthesis C-methylase UbiE
MQYTIPEHYIISQRPHYKTWWKKLRKLLRILKKIYLHKVGFSKRRDHAYVYDNYEKEYSVSNEEWVKRREMKNYEIEYGDTVYIINGMNCHTLRTEIIYSWIKKIGAKKVLEVGSGRARRLHTLSNLDSSLELSGIELSPNGVARGKEWGTNANIRQGDARKLPFADKSFDIAYTNQVLEQIPKDYGLVVAEMKRVAKYCIFVEEFKEAQDLSDWLWVRHKDFFRESYKKIDPDPLFFSTHIPRSKSKYGLGLLVIKNA